MDQFGHRWLMSGRCLVLEIHFFRSGPSRRTVEYTPLVKNNLPDENDFQVIFAVILVTLPSDSWCRDRLFVHPGGC